MPKTRKGKIKKKMSRVKPVLSLRITGVLSLAFLLILAQTDVLVAYEAHVINVTAKIHRINDPVFNIEGRSFCTLEEGIIITAEDEEDGPVSVHFEYLENTLDPNDVPNPTCSSPAGSGYPSIAQLTVFQRDLAVKAVACTIDGLHQGRIVVQVYHFDPELCESGECDAKSAGYWTNNEGCPVNSIWTEEVNAFSSTRLSGVFSSYSGEQICLAVNQTSCVPAGTPAGKLCMAKRMALSNVLNIVSGRLDPSALIAGADDGSSAFNRLGLSAGSTVINALSEIESIIDNSESTKKQFTDAAYVGERIYSFYQDENPVYPLCAYTAGGNGILKDNELCDDGNNFSGDEFSSLCEIEHNNCSDIYIDSLVLGQTLDYGRNNVIITANGEIRGESDLTVITSCDLLVEEGGKITHNGENGKKINLIVGGNLSIHGHLESNGGAGIGKNQGGNIEIQSGNSVIIGNSGKIQANAEDNGGLILIKSGQNFLSLDGSAIEANSSNVAKSHSGYGRGGVIAIEAGGFFRHGGKIEAYGHTGSGGNAVITVAKNVGILENAAIKVDSNGINAKDHGGAIAIKTAEVLEVAGTLNANGNKRGGEISLWSEKEMSVLESGIITAKGDLAKDEKFGGEVYLTTRSWLDFAGSVDTLANSSQGNIGFIYESILYSGSALPEPDEKRMMPGAVVLNEFIPDPVGPDSAFKSNGEWVELYNNSALPVDVSGWYLYNKIYDHEIKISSSKTMDGSTIVPAFGWLTVYRDYDSNFEINKAGDTILLYSGSIDSGADLIDAFNFVIDAPVGHTFARIFDGIGSWYNPEPTPSSKNILGETDYSHLLLEAPDEDGEIIEEIIFDGYIPANDTEIRKNENEQDEPVFFEELVLVLEDNAVAVEDAQGENIIIQSDSAYESENDYPDNFNDDLLEDSIERDSASDNSKNPFNLHASQQEGEAGSSDTSSEQVIQNKTETGIDSSNEEPASGSGGGEPKPEPANDASVYSTESII